ncbi:hypothetical protein D9611_002737 [Ephemerocybe angulata]|uniref:F-box domain-containing protein n=1 Tax=Ephemerocybe angulata TaxID=980116 RepID=A0A8H5C1T3_9AGAR|nr:hypothetical protein D9611_002737 [Tulosesus angulatus]
MDPSKTSNARTSNVTVATSTPFSNSTRILLTSSRQSTPSTYQQKLALRLHEIQLEKQALRTAHNSTTKICSLPDEVLSRIFLDLQELASIERRGAKKQSWVSKTNICRRWREVAIGCASLWTSPYFAYNMQEWAAIMLDRSKQAPLTLNLDEYALLSDNPPDPTSSKGSLLSGIAGRLRVVKIQSTYDSELLSHCQWSTAPILESLTIDNPSGRFGSIGGSIIPDNFLLGGLPSLKKLEILFCFVEWSKLPIHNVPLMTHLSLAGSDKDTQDPNRPSAKALADALRAMPLLESLALVEYLPVNGENPAYPTRTTLPALTSLKLVDSGKRIKHFLDTIALPESASIDIHDRTKVAHSDDIKAQFLGVIACLETGPRANINPSILDGVRRLDVSFGGPNLLNDNWVYKMWPVIDDDTSKPETFKFTYQDPSDRLVAADKLQLLQVFNLDPLETLLVDGCNAVRTDGWRRVFASLPNLKEITLNNGTHFGRFVRAMRLGQLGTDTSVSGESAGPQAFPSL